MDEEGTHKKTEFVYHKFSQRTQRQPRFSTTDSASVFRSKGSGWTRDTSDCRRQRFSLLSTINSAMHQISSHGLHESSGPVLPPRTESQVSTRDERTVSHLLQVVSTPVLTPASPWSSQIVRPVCLLFLTGLYHLFVVVCCCCLPAYHLLLHTFGSKHQNKRVATQTRKNSFRRPSDWNRDKSVPVSFWAVCVSVSFWVVSVSVSVCFCLSLSLSPLGSSSFLTCEPGLSFLFCFKQLQFKIWDFLGLGQRHVWQDLEDKNRCLQLWA